MDLSRGNALRRLGRVAGFQVERVDDGCYVLQRTPARRQVVAIGNNRHARSHLLVPHGKARRQMPMLQRQMAAYLVVEQAAWLMRATEANCVLDVGANVGQYARSMRAAGFEGRIVSFEPVAKAFAKLQAAAADDPDWHVHNYALGRTDGTSEINADPKTLSSMLPSSDFGREWSDRLSQQKTETIQVRRLDGVFDEVTAGLDPVRAFLKMDTQGFDLEAFAGGKGILDQVVALQSEVACVPLYDGMPRLPEQFSAYEAEGFEAAGMFQVSRDSPTLRVIEFDLVMVRPGEVRHPIS